MALCFGSKIKVEYSINRSNKISSLNNQKVCLINRNVFNYINLVDSNESFFLSAKRYIN